MGATSSRGPGDARRRFRLTGPTTPFDQSTQAIRPDLADVDEANHHFAPHYAEAVRWVVIDDCALRSKPANDAAAITTLARGEAFAMLDLTGGWAWGWTVNDHLVGYVAASSLRPDAPAA